MGDDENSDSLEVSAEEVKETATQLFEEAQCECKCCQCKVSQVGIECCPCLMNACCEKETLTGTGVCWKEDHEVKKGRAAPTFVTYYCPDCHRTWATPGNDKGEYHCICGVWVLNDDGEFVRK